MSAPATPATATIGPITLAPAAPLPSNRAGMGAIPYEGGTAFRVWAPFADGVRVAGTFNDWSDSAAPLASEGNGYWSVDVDGAGPGDEYKYVIRNGERTLWKIDPYARQVTNSVGNTVISLPYFEWEDDRDYRAPPWNELVIYELHVGTFNTRPGDRPGSFRSVIRKLDYLRELGVNAIEVMPSMEFATDFSWGYNPAHLFALESAYGGPRGFKRLVRSAHARGIAVFFDTVYNHFGPADLDLWQFDGWSENGKGGIYFYNDHREWTEWGPRPDYGRPEVRQFIRDNALYWLQDFRLDGLRWDATAKIRNIYGKENPAHDLPDGWRLMQRINDEIDHRQPWKLQIAEDLRNNDWITRETSRGGAGFDTQWDSEFVHPVRAALITPDDRARDMHAIRRAIQHRYGGDAFRRVVYTESHDEVANGKTRVPTEIAPGDPTSWAARKRSTLGAALVMTSPGIPMLFQGQEFLEDRWFHDVHPLDWERTERFAGILNLYRDLIRLRRNWHDHTRGLRGQHVNVFHVNDADKLVGFHRWNRGGARDDVVVVANFANRAYGSYTLGLPHPGRWRVRFNSDWNGYSPDFGNHFSYDTVADGPPRDGLPHSGNLGIGPYSAVILSQDG
jgi:1,4-alpha-glucan branching enzyme